MADYKINGVDITLQPERFGFKNRNPLGVDGNNRPVYPPTYEAEVYWGTMSMSEFNQLYAFWQSISGTGSVSLTVPQLDAGSFTFKTYTGVILEEPEKGPFWNNNYITRVTMGVRNIVM